MPSPDGASAGCGPTTSTKHDNGDGQQPPTSTPTPAVAKPEFNSAPAPAPAAAMTLEYDDFGLPIRKYTAPPLDEPSGTAEAGTGTKEENKGTGASASGVDGQQQQQQQQQQPPAEASPAGRKDMNSKQPKRAVADTDSDSEGDFQDAPSRNSSEAPHAPPNTEKPPSTVTSAKPSEHVRGDQADEKPGQAVDQAVSESARPVPVVNHHKRDVSNASLGLGGGGISEYSHQQLTTDQKDNKKPGDGDNDDDGGWQDMPAYAPYDIYDDDNKLVAKEYHEDEDADDTYGYAGLGGAGKGYTKVLLDDDAESATSLDEHTQYLFKDAGGGTSTSIMDDEQRDAVSQLQATKELLTEGQRIAYVGLTRLELSSMIKDAESLDSTSKSTKKQLAMAAENMKMWAQKMMIRLYTHMDISPAEQVMIEQLASHGVMPQDLTPVLMANARVKNPMAEEEKEGRSSVSGSGTGSPGISRPASIASHPPEQAAEPPPPYSANGDAELTAPVRTPSQMPTTQKIDIDIRWTVLCDLFLVLIADSIYDARSRLLLEKVANDLGISWLDICRFEKKVTDALEMQASADRENWNEEEHMENRRKMALKRRYMMMGLATVGGGLVIGLSAGLLAPVIGMGLAAGFTTIGIGGTGGFLAGAGGAAIITSTAATSGGIIGGRAANRRTGAVRTFEYRPLHNNKRVNLIVTVSGWMTGKVDDVRLPFSTVDPVMGDIYSVLWEPEMLTSMGDTINILATEALTQGLQQVLGNTILVALMAALQVPVVLTKLAYLIDNPWAVSLDRATMAGLILADSLIDRNLGTRPVTLVGYSLGSRVIFSCLQELAKKGAYGLVQNVYLFGAPVVVKHDEWLRARTVVAGRFVNGYNRNDWILGYLFRLTSGGIRRVAGLAPVEVVPGIDNMDVSALVEGHMSYRQRMPRLMRECGWMVESDEFVEIEDPDPDNYRERQRELINEIEEARKEAEKEQAKGGNKGGAFSFFKRKKNLQKQEWEIYEDSKTDKAGSGGKTEDKDGNNHGVLFDVDAIRAEIAKERQNQEKNQNQNKDADFDEELLQVREIKSTLPPIKLDLESSSSNLGTPATTKLGLAPPPRTGLRESKSADALPFEPYDDTITTRRSSHEPPPQSQSSTTTTRSGLTPAGTFSGLDDASGRSKSPYHAYGQSYGDYDEAEDGVQMTFDEGGPGHDRMTQMTFGSGFGHDDEDDIASARPLRSAGTAATTGGLSASGYGGGSSSVGYGYAGSASGYGGYGGGGYASSSWLDGGNGSGEKSTTDVTSHQRSATAQTTTTTTTGAVAGVPNSSALANPWADDDDDEEFGKEKEIQMTFA
ncbi:hypothetical protein VTJ49DRAFT_4549 [Mycothermus thermophilus]|uniref:DUF726-domain-containing protein n=1 Tax=Humicola insolens TaxID=85995 RepID=A0ABR3V529_HUMIN